MRIISFEDKYRDDMIFMVLGAKNALGRVPRLNEEFLNIKASYFDKGHPFWIALDEYDRVIGCIGTREDEEGNLHSFRELFMDTPEPVELDVTDTLGDDEDGDE